MKLYYRVKDKSNVYVVMIRLGNKKRSGTYILSGLLNDTLLLVSENNERDGLIFQEPDAKDVIEYIRSKSLKIEIR